MTVANNYAPARYVGNGSTRSFAVSWRLENDDDFVVYQKVGGVQSVVDPSNYTAVNTDNEHGVVFNTAPANGTIIVITRATPHEQDTPYKTSSGFQAIKVEEDFDSLTMMVQELQNGVDRAVKVPETSTETQQHFSDSLFTARDEARGYAEDAARSEGNAAGSATDARLYAEDAEASKNKARDWAYSLTPVESGLYGARYYATLADGYSGDAAESATNAHNDAVTAYDEKVAAAGFASDASDAANLAKDWATKDSTPVASGLYSSKYYASQSSDNADRAEFQASNAESYAESALGYKGEASDSATSASGSATLAQNWATKMDGTVDGVEYSAKYYADLAGQNAGVLSGANKDLSNLTATGEAKFTAKQDVIDSSHKLSASLVDGLATVATTGAYGDLTGTPSLATVATSGSYNDLSNKPNLSGYALDNAVVHLAGTETITGSKTFTHNATITKQAPRIKLKHTLITKGVAPSEMRNLVLDFVDSNEDELGFVRDVYYTDTSHYIQIKCDKANNPTDTDSAGIKVGYYGSTKVFIPDDDNATSLGRSGARWTQLYAGTTTISTSDEREKQNIEAIPDAVLDAWGEVEFYRFKYKDAVAEKGSAARWHTGMIAQRIESVFTAHGLDAHDYGLLCYDEWEAEDEIPAGNRYALRYEECLTMEAAYQRRRADRIEARLAALEARV